MISWSAAGRELLQDSGTTTSAPDTTPTPNAPSAPTGKAAEQPSALSLASNLNPPAAPPSLSAQPARNFAGIPVCLSAAVPTTPVPPGGSGGTTVTPTPAPVPQTPVPPPVATTQPTQPTSATPSTPQARRTAGGSKIRQALPLPASTCASRPRATH